jgi:serine/threonine protein kinase
MAGQLQGLGRWRLLDVCAEGEFATIYRARSDEAAVTEPPVALKVVRSESLHEVLDAEAFADRAARAMALSDTAPDPIIARVRDFGEADGRAWLAMELIDGLSLDRIGAKRSRGRLPVEAAVVVIRDVLTALQSALDSANPTAHGRVGRSHILIDVDGGVRLIGFGSVGQDRVDLLAVGRLSGHIAKTWPPEVDAWVDKLEDGDQAFDTPGEALEAFPLDAFDDDVLEKGRKALARVVARERKKAIRAAAQAERDATGQEPEGQGRSGLGDAATGGTDQELSVRQARRVMWACTAVLLAAVTIEILRFSG